jgi:hypothetical protein
MDAAADRLSILRMARSLISRDGTSFTLAGLCRENNLTRSELRKAFPTRAALITALAKPARSELAEQKVPQKVSAADDEWLERRFRVFERAIESLELKIEAANAERSRSIAAPAESATPKALASIEPISVPEPPPFVSEIVQSKDNDTAADITPFESEPDLPGSTATVLQPIAEDQSMPSGRVRTEVMRGILENARALANSTHEEVSQKMSKRATLKLVFISISIVITGVIIGFAMPKEPARATQTTLPGGPRAVSKAFNVTVINAADNGKPAPVPKSVSIKDLKDRATRGDVRAQADLALAYLRGDGVSRDPIAAAGWSQLAAARGEPLAEFILGTLYSDGIKPDPHIAFQWLAAAALRGNVKAMHNLAIAYLSGAGVDKNPAAAANWFSKAASLGYQDSAFDLAVLYERGDGVPQSPQTALHWYDGAAATGDREAAQRASLLRVALSESVKK